MKYSGSGSVVCFTRSKCKMVVMSAPMSVYAHVTLLSLLVCAMNSIMYLYTVLARKNDRENFQQPPFHRTVDVTPREGLLVLFPGWLTHQVSLFISMICPGCELWS